MMPLALIILIIFVGCICAVGGILWLRQHNNFLALSHYNAGVSYLQTGDYVKAEYEFNTAIKRKRKMLEARYGLGLVYVHQQRYHEGTEMLESAIQGMPQNAIAYYNLGRAYINTGNLEKAQQVLEDALKINTQVKEIHFNLGRVAQEKGNLEQAKIHYNNALKLDRNYGRAKEYLKMLTGARLQESIQADVILNALKNFDQDDIEFLLAL